MPRMSRAEYSNAIYHIVAPGDGRRGGRFAEVRLVATSLELCGTWNLTCSVDA